MAGHDGVLGFAGFRKDAPRLAAGCFTAIMILLNLTEYAAAGPYAPAAGQPGSTAVHMNSNAIARWATGWTNYVVGERCDSRWQTPEKAIGKAAGTSFDIVCLGGGGRITMTFDRTIEDGPGADFLVFGNSFNGTFLKLAYVEVSSDGINFTRFFNRSLTPNPVPAFGAADPTDIIGLGSKYIQGYGEPYNLADLGLNNIQYIRLQDVMGDGSYLDSAGHVIYYPYKTTGSGGFNLDAIAVLSKSTPTVTTWPTASAITCGQALSASILSGGAASVAGSFAFTTPGTKPPAGTAICSVTFTPTDTDDYNTVAGTVTVTVNKATPTVTTWPTASAIIYGQALSASTLSGGAASVAGSFAFTTPGTIPPAGMAICSATFTPNDTANYNTVAGTVIVTVYTADQVGWLAIQVTPASGTWWLTDPVEYAGPTSGTGNLAAVIAPTGLYYLVWGALSDYVSPTNQTRFITGGSATLFTGVYLQISTNIGTPSVSATEGTYTNKVRISWQGVDEALGYEVWRNWINDTDTAGRIADIPAISSFAGKKNLCDLGASAVQIAPTAWKLGNTYIYDDYGIVPIHGYYYWVRAKTATQISPMNYAGMGYASLPPEQAQGTADIAVRDLVFLPVNVTNLSHAGTVSCRLANNGPDALNAAGVAFDFHMARKDSSEPLAKLPDNTATTKRGPPETKTNGHFRNGSPRATSGGTRSVASVGSSAGDSSFIWIGTAQSNMTLSVGAEELIILNPSLKRGLTVRGDLSGIQQVKVTVRHLSALNDPNLANNTTNAAGSVRIKTSGVNSPGRSLNDYDGDGKSDLCLYQSTLGRWYAVLSGDRYGEIVWIGDVGLGWMPVPGDYDGDGLTDVAAYELSSGQWLAKFTSSDLVGECRLGGAEFTAAQCDFDGDSMTDPVAYREADGYWLGAASSRQYALCDTFLGETGYQSVAADYDGDGLADPAVYNRTTGLWGVALSSAGYQMISGGYGGPGFVAVPADYDGDGRVDFGLYEYATGWWYVLMSNRSTGPIGQDYREAGGQLGAPYGLPVVADYDGDGLADPAVYSDGNWSIYLMGSGGVIEGGFGAPGWIPVK